LQALHLDLVADLRAPDNSPAHLVASGVLNTDTRRLAVDSLQVRYRAASLQLLAPAHISFRDGVVTDRLRVGVAGLVVELAGRIEPTLDVTASVRNDASAGKGTLGMPPVLKGGLAVDARITGNLAHSAVIDAKISLGSQAQMIASGQLPFSAYERIDLHAKGTIDAAIANSFLADAGRRLRGHVAVSMDVSGTLHAPQIIGTLQIADAEYEDDNLGAHLTGIEALVSGSGDSLQIGHFTAKAGPGTLSVTGTVGLLASNLPIDLQVTARNAQPMASDLVVANMDADIHLHGTVASRVDAAGTIKVNRADVSIPNALPPSVGVLDVLRPGQPPAQPAAASATVIGLDLKVDAPSAVFVRGRGIDAEMGGSLTIAGTSAAPRISGGFDLRRGNLDLAGSTLTFNSGRVGFNGTGLNRKIDPTLDFEAQSQSTSFTAKLDVTGYADAPKISLSSTPEMPQDEILAQLLFGTSVNKLTALQMVQIGSAIATIGGLGSAGGSALSTVQKRLGLDRLSVGNTPTGATSVEAGRYVYKGVFVGARQMGTAGGTTQAIVQIDLTKQLKAVGAFGNGGTVQGATPDNDPGNSIGILYQIEY
jgi:translocation and assembly module TamB